MIRGEEAVNTQCMIPYFNRVWAITKIVEVPVRDTAKAQLVKTHLSAPPPVDQPQPPFLSSFLLHMFFRLRTREPGHQLGWSTPGAIP